MIMTGDSGFVSVADLEEVFGAGYPPDETILLPAPREIPTIVQESEPPDSAAEPPDSATTIRQTLATGIALAVFVATLIAMRRRTRREGQ